MNNTFIPVRVISKVVNYFNPYRTEAQYSSNYAYAHIIDGVLDNGDWYLTVEHVSGLTFSVVVTPDNRLYEL